MKPEQITITVDQEAADVYRGASEQDRRKMDALLSLRLHELGRPVRPLDDIMREMGEKARQRGMTPEILKSILNGD